ncbi:MAG: type VI secretion system tube protein Hcp [Chitinophagaceae bacterium]|nr:type VI secretion system tube protein Hcp [Chitinophagaceae bacterium]
MAYEGYLVAKAQKQGQIKGSVIQKGKEGWIAVYGFHHEIVSPREVASGLATGKRQHKPLTITKEIDKSTPLLYQALVNNESFSEVALRFFASDTKGAGKGAEIYTIKLTNANISSIVDDMANIKIAENIKLPLLEMISFTYQKIEWTWNDGGITSTDRWETK